MCVYEFQISNNKKDLIEHKCSLKHFLWKKKPSRKRGKTHELEVFSVSKKDGYPWVVGRVMFHTGSYPGEHALACRLLNQALGYALVPGGYFLQRPDIKIWQI